LLIGVVLGGAIAAVSDSRIDDKIQLGVISMEFAWFVVWLHLSTHTVTIDHRAAFFTGTECLEWLDAHRTERTQATCVRGSFGNRGAFLWPAIDRPWQMATVTGVTVEPRVAVT
jgi:hypothetical protein